MKNYLQNSLFFALFSLITLFSMQACSVDSSAQAIDFGHQQCAYCKMTISDQRFAAQFITDKGRAYSFDDLHCLIAYVKEGQISREEIAAFYLPDFFSKKMHPAEQLYYLKSEDLNSPMRGNIAAFINHEDLLKAQEEFSGVALSWEELWQ